MDLLVKAGRVKSGWNGGPFKGMITQSLVVIGHRAGNPKGIKDWSDLARPGVGVLYPDPKTSGGARWNINAIYGSAYQAARESKGGQADPAAVREFLARVQANVINMDQSGRQSMANFAERGTGDAVVTYENELLLHNKERAPIPYVIPPPTLLIESPAAVVDSSVESHGNRKVAEAFLEFLLSEEGQKIVADYGFRPVRPGVAPPAQAQPMPTKLFTMADLGGWAKVEAGTLRAQGPLDLHLHRRRRRESLGEVSRGMAIGLLSSRTGATGIVLRGTTLFYLGIMVVLPMAALVIESARPGASAFVDAVRDPFAWHALKLTFLTASLMVVINAVTGTATAWVLVRYDFPGRGLVNALIDLPFAVPTVVTGVMLVVLYGPSSVIGTILGEYGWGVIYHQPGIVLALLFVTYPFVIRSVQPVLMELDRAEEEAAATLGASAWTTFRRVTLARPVALDPHGLGALVRPGARRVRQRGDGGRQSADVGQDGPALHLRRGRERQPARGDGGLRGPARRLLADPARHQCRPAAVGDPRWPLTRSGCRPGRGPRHRRPAAPGRSADGC